MDDAEERMTFLTTKFETLMLTSSMTPLLLQISALSLKIQPFFRAHSVLGTGKCERCGAEHYYFYTYYFHRLINLCPFIFILQLVDTACLGMQYSWYGFLVRAAFLFLLHVLLWERPFNITARGHGLSWDAVLLVRFLGKSCFPFSFACIIVGTSF